MSNQRDYVREVKELEEYVDISSKERRAWESNCLKMLSRDHIEMNERELAAWLLFKMYTQALDVSPLLCKNLRPLLEKSPYIRIYYYEGREVVQFNQVGKEDDDEE